MLKRSMNNVEANMTKNLNSFYHYYLIDTKWTTDGYEAVFGTCLQAGFDLF